MAKEIFISGGIFHPNDEEIDLGKFNDEFIGFVESKGLAFEGVINKFGTT